MSEVGTWLETVYMMDLTGDHDKAIDIVFDRIDDMLCAGDFAGVDGIIDGVDLGRLSTGLIIGLLSITLAAGDQLSRRESLVARAERWLTMVESERVVELMDGLR